MTADLAAFLEARYDEDERRAGQRIHLIGPDDTPHFLADLAAKRQIVALHPIRRDLSKYEQSNGGHSFGCETCHEWDGIICGAGYCDTLLALAQPYADHPDFDPEWRDTPEEL